MSSSSWRVQSLFFGLAVAAGTMVLRPAESNGGSRSHSHGHSRGHSHGRGGHVGLHFGRGHGAHFSFGGGHRHSGHYHLGRRHSSHYYGGGHGYGYGYGYGRGHFGYSYPSYFSYSRSYPRYHSYGFPSYGLGYRSFSISVPRYYAYSGSLSDCGSVGSAAPMPYAPGDADSSTPAEMYRSTPDLPAAEGELPAGENSGSSTRTRLEFTSAPSRGWRLLAAGQPVSALREFAVDVERDLSNGVHKVGYSLAAASAGDLSRGIWAMRRAYRIDPASARAVDVRQFDKRLVRAVQRVKSDYQRYAERRSGEAGPSFMLASLHYLSGDNGQAQQEIELAQRRGDRTASANNLESAITVRLAQRKTRESRLAFQPDDTDVPDPPGLKTGRLFPELKQPSVGSAPQVLGGQEF